MRRTVPSAATPTALPACVVEHGALQTRKPARAAASSACTPAPSRLTTPLEARRVACTPAPPAAACSRRHHHPLLRCRSPQTAWTRGSGARSCPCRPALSTTCSCLRTRGRCRRRRWPVTDRKDGAACTAGAWCTAWGGWCGFLSCGGNGEIAGCAGSWASSVPRRASTTSGGGGGAPGLPTHLAQHSSVSREMVCCSCALACCCCRKFCGRVGAARLLGWAGELFGCP